MSKLTMDTADRFKPEPWRSLLVPNPKSRSWTLVGLLCSVNSPPLEPDKSPNVQPHTRNHDRQAQRRVRPAADSGGEGGRANTGTTSQVRIVT